MNLVSSIWCGGELVGKRLFCALLITVPIGASAQAALSSAPPIRLTREYVLQGDADNPSLTTVVDARFGRDGELLVLDRGDMRVRRFGSAGASVGAFGKSGSGPGEFRGLSRSGWLGDSLWVFDGAQRRISVFFDGAYARSFNVASPIPPPHSLMVPLAIRGRTVRLGVATTSIEHDGTQPDFLLYRDDPLTSSAKVVRHISRTRATFAFDAVLRGRTMRRLGPQPFSDAPVFAADPRGGAVVVEGLAATSARPAELTISRYDPLGMVRFTRTLTYRPSALDPATRATATDLNRNASADGVRRPRVEYDEAAFRRALFLPTFLPPVKDVAVGHDGSIWLTLWESEAAPERTTVMLSEDGTPLGSIRLPRSYRVFDSRDGRLVAGEIPWDDVNTIAVYRVTRSPSK